MLKRGIGLGLLCITGHAFSANITVTTTEDIVKADDQCSLREAVEYVNQGMPEAGYNGCGGKDATAKIMLQANKEYSLNNQIRILKDVAFGSDYQTNVNDTEAIVGRRNAIIKMVGKERLFQIEKTIDPNATTTPALLNVAFDEITLKGCGQSVCADQGGLIYNKEALGISNSQLLDGAARQGGAIYNAGIYTANTALSTVSISKTLMKGNKATEGGVIYAELPSFIISQSLIRDNETTNNNSSNFETLNQFSEDALKAIGSAIPFGIVNSTIFSNKGYVVKIYDAMQVNNITMILNSMGLIVNAPQKKGFVANSIVAQNGTQDCTIVAGGEAEQISNNLYSSGCTGFKSTTLGNAQLIAGSTTEGKCDYSTNGILCPFTESPTIALGYFLPRILPSYNSAEDSLIINHGPSVQDKILSCSAVDQRAKSRDINAELCDRGAIELVINTADITTVGQDILYGEKAKFSISDQLQDGELVSVEKCKQIFNRELDDNGKPWQVGCLKVVQTNTPSKGSLTIDQAGDLVYTPNGNWQGSDEFKISVVTSTTSFNKSDNPYITIPARVVQRKPDDFKDYKVKTSGGSLGFFSIVGLIGLAGYRRIKYK
ncbi:rhombotarget A [Acinetobacter sp.]|jgi:rhombotarget A family protien|uniref:rhombotarget A n=1 Tax=Acinetobacter sp. TaxID=472 RepID=UPI0028219647|nr:rhombotarget A [Acinetobacter sp.]MDR0237267.1 rhombotarget A [Acinetobacter sp.]